MSDTEGKDLALCTCALCGSSCAAWRFICPYCLKELGLWRAPYSAWPEWLNDLRRYHQRQREKERVMLAHYVSLSVEYVLENGIEYDCYEPSAEETCLDQADGCAWLAQRLRTEFTERVTMSFLLKRLTTRQAQAMRLVKFHGMTTIDAGREMGISHQVVSKLVQAAQERLRI
jgi:DNA-directed RNA polymerase specialized sigma24 family protein